MEIRISNSNRITFDEFLKACDIVERYIVQQKIVIKDAEIFKERIPHFGVTLESGIEDLTMSVGLFNSLRYHIGYKEGGIKVKDLLNISLSDFGRCRNVGPKRITELKEILKHYQLQVNS